MAESETPKISVVMSIYNEPADWLRKSIDSILNQTYGDFEFIIVNDNPQSISNRKLLEDYQKRDLRILIIENSNNIGLTKSLNVGLSKASGTYIARMDADDISLPHRFEKQVEFMNLNPNCVVCGTWMNYFNESDLMELIREPIESDDIKRILLMRNCIAHPTVFIRRATLVLNSIRYNEQVRYCQDYDLFSRLAMYGTLANIPESLLKYRRSDQQISTSKKEEQRELGYNIGYSYFLTVLASYGLRADSLNLPSKIRSLKIAANEKRYLLFAYYANLRLSSCLTSPLLNGDLFQLGELYLSSVKRSFYRFHKKPVM
ncbi:glycosyltransferase [Dyadobacter psychrophilus]|uniref:Glycosyl transferase family 2 n=1 Tax=Dyadobacter psychrophilus TaxID=651661 RepID=A0A1T5HCL1_9BACT|nr:glycosyltransferase [Dyadobacter psychrophilus]SKC18435.1 Glycosyl transferase family 2 [Dyadobacter psychrophilus]